MYNTVLVIQSKSKIMCCVDLLGTYWVKILLLGEICICICISSCMSRFIKVFDPQAMNNTKKEYPEFNYANNTIEACENVDAVIIATEWNEFRAMDMHALIKKVKRPIIAGFERFIPKETLIGSSPIIAEKPPNNDIIAPVELAFFQYRPKTNTDIAPVKYIAPVIPK